MTKPLEQVDLVIFVGPSGSSPIEQTVARVRHAVTRDLICLAQACEHIGEIVVATAEKASVEDLDHRTVHVEVDDVGKPFHFGQCLTNIIERYSIQHVLYFGAGAAPLICLSTLNELCHRLLTKRHIVSANNFWSTDFLGWTPASAITNVDLPARRDNELARLLHGQAGLSREDIQPSARSLFDLDTPQDIAILNLHHATHPHTREALRTIRWHQEGWSTDSLRDILPHLIQPSAEVCLIGRVSNIAFGGLRQDLACRLRIFAEERGMQASGRDQRGEVRSLLGMFLEDVGPTAFFAALAGLGASSVLMDTRVIFQHLGLKPSTADRFYSDLGCVEKITDPDVRSFTAAAHTAPISLVLGGQSLVGGGLWAITEAAWQQAEDGFLSRAS